jgi:hypothetical protein
MKGPAARFQLHGDMGIVFMTQERKSKRELKKCIKTF